MLSKAGIKTDESNDPPLAKTDSQKLHELLVVKESQLTLKESQLAKIEKELLGTMSTVDKFVYWPMGHLKVFEMPLDLIL